MHRKNKYVSHIYRLASSKRFKRIKRMKKIFWTLRIVKLFFLTLKYRQFRQLAQKAAAKDGLFQCNYCLLLEGRLVSFLYRTNFMYNMFNIIQFVKGGNMFVNRIAVSYVNMSINVGDVVTFLKKDRVVFYRVLVVRALRRSFTFNTPRYLFVSYKLFFAYMKRYPFRKDLAYPFKRFDIFRATGYY